MSFDRVLRQFIYETIARTGRPPSHEAMAEHRGLAREEVEAALVKLEEQHALALAPTTRNIWMAHPFSAVPTPFAVEGDQLTYWANCAWELVAIPPLLKLDARAEPRCAESGEPMPMVFRAGELVEGDGFIHFIVPPRRFWDNVGYT